ncbi:fumarylacetoacetate hydrolase domain-containing protein 2 [Planococcus citri]|uniref:fumarylacetoacetate hydrolase domain-containing protein 2 n=1 Tax=Planococcus citri TaxID=170843 RepID=UPI0031F72933
MNVLKNIFGKSSYSYVEKIHNVRKFHLSSANKTRFVQYTSNENTQSLGILSKDSTEVIDLSNVNSSIPNTLVEYLRNESEYSKIIPKILNEKKLVYKTEQIKLLAPVTKPDKVICVGLNYKGHCDEQNKPYPEEPFFFTKFPSTIIGPNDALLLPVKSKAVDWEVELTVVIGKTARFVNIEDASEYIFGYTVAQDISARDWQTPKKNNGQWIFAKSMDQFCPLGPCVVTKDEIPDPHNLQISCSVNGVQKQNANTVELIHRIDKLVSYLSELITLLPGDIILTGTPSGVGVFRNPREFLKPGDRIKSEISSIGVLENSIV